MIRVMIGAAAVFLAAALGIVSVIWSEHVTPLTLPALTGQYPVGRAAYDWTDESRDEILAPETHAKRELTVWIWYPASMSENAVSAEYLPRPWRASLAHLQGPLVTFMMHDASLIHGHSFEGVPIARGKRTYPVIVLKPGIGTLALDYTALAEDLASHGYVVVASDSPYSTFVVVFQNGRIAVRRSTSNFNRLIQTWVADDRFVLNRLAKLNASDSSGRFRGRLNLHAVGAMGHSFGGATAAEFCHEDRRCKAGVDVDGRLFGQAIQTGMDRPFMFLMSDHSSENSPDKAAIVQELQTLYDRLPRGRMLVTLRHSGHFSFSDLSLAYNPVVSRVSGQAGSIDPARGLLAASACLRTYFDIHLKGASPATLQTLRAEYPELKFADDSIPLAQQM